MAIDRTRLPAAAQAPDAARAGPLVRLRGLIWRRIMGAAGRRGGA